MCSKTMENVKQCLAYGIDQLSKEQRLEVEMLLAFVLGYNRAQLLSRDDQALTMAQDQQFKELIAKRKNHEPLQYLLGTTNFMGLDFKVTPSVLIPRFDTEILVEKALALLRGTQEQRCVLDLCTGSGAIGVSIAKLMPKSEVWASDLSPQALTIAEENSTIHQAGVNFKCGDLFKPFGRGFRGYFQLIASNPPYITSDEFAQLPKEVRQEPTMALWGGVDGLKFYWDIAKESPIYLAENGYLIFEIGFAQGEAVAGIMKTNGFEGVEILKDWQGHDRVVFGQYNRS